MARELREAIRDHITSGDYEHLLKALGYSMPVMLQPAGVTSQDDTAAAEPAQWDAPVKTHPTSPVTSDDAGMHRDLHS